MEWLDELAEVTGIDRIIAIGAQRLMRGPITFRSPYWDGDVVIETLEGYRSWVRTCERINEKPVSEQRAREIRETERNSSKEQMYQS